jgi:cytochrome c-type biogenesis protein CcmE
MKKLGFLGLLALVACQNNPEAETTSSNSIEYPIYEQVEVEVGGNVVYGVIVRDSSAERSNRGYEVTFKLQDRVWIDTVFLELPPKQMVQGEMIFAEAVVNDMGGASYEVKRLEIE